MAKESDQKTIKGILGARTKLVEVKATLFEIDPEHDDVILEVRRARGLAAALGRQLFRLDEVVSLVNQGRRPPQMELADVIRGARAEVPNLRDEESDAIKRAAETGGDREDEEEDLGAGSDRRGPRPAPPLPAAENAVAFFAPPAIVAEALSAHAGRSLPEAFVATWSAEDRAAALRWAHNRRDGGNAPVPEILAPRYLEDRDLSVEEERRWLAESVGLQLDGGDLYATPAFLEWAAAVHRRDRGDRGVSVPEPPVELQPPVHVFGAIKTRVAETPCTLGALVETFPEEGVALGVAVRVLLAAGEIVEGDDFLFHAGRPDLVADAGDLYNRSRTYLTRGGNLADDPEPEPEEVAIAEPEAGETRPEGEEPQEEEEEEPEEEEEEETGGEGNPEEPEEPIERDLYTTVVEAGE